MFRIKNVRNATTAKYTQPQPSPPRPTPKVQKPQAVEPSKRTIGNVTKAVQLRPNPTGRIVGRKKEAIPLNAAVAKHKLVIAHNKGHENVEEQKRQQASIVEEKADVPQGKAVPTPTKIEEQKSVIKETAIQKDNLLSRQSNPITYAHITEKRIDPEQQRRNEEEAARLHQLKEQRRKQKEAEEKEEQLKREEELNQVTKKIMERRKAREEERKRRQEVQRQWEQAQLAAAPGNGAMINLTDSLAHVQMSDATMDVQVALILRMKFAGYPNQQTLQQQQQELERINQSYLMVRSQPNHPLTRGLSNFRTELFNRVGELIMQAQAQMGPSHAGMRIINADSRNYPEIRDMRITRGLEQSQMQLLLSEQQLLFSQDCAICLTEMPAGETAVGIECGHRFHPKCLKQWLSTSASCPSCRYNIKQGRKAK